MATSITASDSASHPIILNGGTTSNITYRINKASTYNLTGTDGDKFTVTYTNYENDNDQSATLHLKSAANINSQLAYNVTLIATPLNGDTSASKPITIYTSSSPSQTTGRVLPAFYTLSADGVAVDASLTELTGNPYDATASVELILPLAYDYTKVTPTFLSGHGAGYTVARNANRIVISSTASDADAGDASGHLIDGSIRLTYVDTSHSNTGVGSNITYTKDISLTFRLLPADISFVTTDGGSTVISNPSVHFDGSNASSLATLRKTDGALRAAVAADTSIGIFLNQKVKWALSLPTAGSYTGFSADACANYDLSMFSLCTDTVETALGANTAAQTAYLKFVPGPDVSQLHFAKDDEYVVRLTLTDPDPSNNETDARKTKVQDIRVVVTSDTTKPIIADVSHNIAQSFTALTHDSTLDLSTATTNVNELYSATVPVFTFDICTALQGPNDLSSTVQYYLCASNLTTAAGTNTSLGVASQLDTSLVTFTVSNETTTGKAHVFLSNGGPLFKDNYADPSENRYVFKIFAQDSNSNNASQLVQCQVNVMNISGNTYHNVAGLNGNIVSNGVVTEGGRTNASLIQVGAVTSVPVKLAGTRWNTFEANKATEYYDISFIEDPTGAATDKRATLISNLALGDVSHPVYTNQLYSSKKISFDISGLTNGKTYRIILPGYTAADSHQNAQTSLNTAKIHGTNDLIYDFTFDTDTKDISFAGPDNIVWPRGQPYSEIFFSHVSGGAAYDLSTHNHSKLGAQHDGTTGNIFSYYNAVDPTDPSGTVGYFTWTLTTAAGAQTSRTRQVTIGGPGTFYGIYNAPDISYDASRVDYRAPPSISNEVTANLTFAGTGSTVTQPVALVYNDLSSGTTTTNAAGAAITLNRSTAFTTNQLGKLWTYTGPGNVANATLTETYSVANEDVYSFNWAETTGADPSGEFAADASRNYLSIGAGDTSATSISKTGKSSSGRTNWDTTTGYLENIQGKRTFTMIEPTGHQIDVSFGAIDASSNILTTFTLATSDNLGSLDETKFVNYATIDISMSKTLFNNVFYFKPETNNLMGPNGEMPALNTLRSETIDICNAHLNWPRLKNHQDKDIKNLEPSNYKGTTYFESAIPASGNTIHDIAVENWCFDIFNLRDMKDAFSTANTITPMENEVDTYLTSVAPTDGSFVSTDIFEGSIRKLLRDAPNQGDGNGNSAASVDQIKANIGKYLLYRLHEDINATPSAHYRLTSAEGGMFHPSNMVPLNDASTSLRGYYPFLFHAGDKLTVGFTLKHASVDISAIFAGTSGTRTLGDLPFKVVITMV
jgi:hypothetical protein